MGLLAWVMMGLAIWHFTIFLPDRFWGGIVGAFVGALVGAIVVRLLDRSTASRIPGEQRHRRCDRAGGDPGRADRHGASVYLEGMRRERERRAQR